MTPRRFVLAASLVCVLLGAHSATGASATYFVRYEGGSVMHIDARLPGGDGRLLMAQGGGIDHLPDQWATFVRDLRVRSRDGSPVAATAAGKEGWRIGSSDAVDVAYDVHLDYAIGQWPAGNEQSGRLFPHALYTVTKPLFVTTSAVTDAEIEFHLPAGWRVATPWEASSEHRFLARSAARLTQNSIVLGIFPSARIRVGAFAITVAVPGASTMPPRLTQALRQVGTTAANLFDQTPRGKYLMTFFREA